MLLIKIALALFSFTCSGHSQQASASILQRQPWFDRRKPFQASQKAVRRRSFYEAYELAQQIHSAENNEQSYFLSRVLLALSSRIVAFSPSGVKHRSSPGNLAFKNAHKVVLGRDLPRDRVSAFSMNDDFHGGTDPWGCKPHPRIPTLGRREALFGAAALLSSCKALPAAAIVGGKRVTDAEAANAGIVGLSINLDGCDPEVCQKGLPAECTGTLIAPDLVLSNRHCAEYPVQFNGTLDKAIFGAKFDSKTAMTRKVVGYKSAAEYGFDQQDYDLLMVKLESNAPEPWKTVSVPARLLPTKEEQEEATQANSALAGGLGMPSATAFGYGQQRTDGLTNLKNYKAGELFRIDVQAQTEIQAYGAGFLSGMKQKGTGICQGDSGGPALINIADPLSGGARQLLLGVQTASTSPCRDNKALFLYPQFFADFILKASKDLGSPINPGLSWRDFR